MVAVTTKVKTVLISIDFGTSCSGFAYAFTRDPSGRVYTFDKWNGGGSVNTKTVTQILLNNANQLIEFGYKARDHHMVSDIPYALYSYYKMSLYNKETRVTVENANVVANNCAQLATSKQLITETLRFFLKLSLETVSRESSTPISADDVLWVITVPAIWDDSAKQIMRRCAQDAGLCDVNDKDSLIFAYEPEAGALQCVYEATSGAEYSINVGEKFFVLDLGGGTADFIGYIQRADGKLDAITSAIGGDWGSSYVNENFIKFLIEMFGEGIRPRLNTSEFQEVMDKFELVKKSFTDSSCLEDEHKFIQNFSPETLFGQNLDWLNARLLSYNSLKGTNVLYRRGNLAISLNVFMSFFQPLFDKIVTCIKQELVRNIELRTNLKYMFMIGGFSENYPLCQLIKKEFEGSLGCRVIVPARPSLAVVTGAARYGLRPSLITRRIVSKSYAIEIDDPIRPGHHADRKPFNIAGVPYARNVCDVYVTAGQSIGSDETITRRYVPTSSDQKVVELAVFSSNIPVMNYTDDPGVQFVGVITLTIPNPGAPVDQRQIEATMKFGGTEVTVSATHVATGIKTDATFDFIVSSEEAQRRNDARREQQKPPSVQLSIVMDCTGSMQSWINESKSKMIEMSRSLANIYTGLNLEISFIGYRDYKDSNRFEVVPFTTDLGALETRLGSVKAEGGGDAPEDVAGGFQQCLSLPWKPSFTKLVVHVADAPCHGTKYHGYADDFPLGDPTYHPEQQVKKMRDNGIDYYFISITSSTDQMINIFRSVYDTDQKKIVVQNLGERVDQLIPSLINFVTNTIKKV